MNELLGQLADLRGNLLSMGFTDEETYELCLEWWKMKMAVHRQQKPFWSPALPEPEEDTGPDENT